VERLKWRVFSLVRSGSPGRPAQRGAGSRQGRLREGLSRSTPREHNLIAQGGLRSAIPRKLLGACLSGRSGTLLGQKVVGRTGNKEGVLITPRGCNPQQSVAIGSGRLSCSASAKSCEPEVSRTGFDGDRFRSVAPRALQCCCCQNRQHPCVRMRVQARLRPLRSAAVRCSHDSVSVQPLRVR
jgi:hypothetical protein